MKTLKIIVLITVINISIWEVAQIVGDAFGGTWGLWIYRLVTSYLLVRILWP